MSEAPAVELLRVDPRLEELVASLFWAAFPARRLGRAPVDADGRVPLLVDAALGTDEARRWQRALDDLLTQPFATDAGAYQREVRDAAGTRTELALPVAPDAYRGGAWLVGPFADRATLDAWAEAHLRSPWVHDAAPHAAAWHADVFLADADGADADGADTDGADTDTTGAG